MREEEDYIEVRRGLNGNHIRLKMGMKTDCSGEKCE